MKRFSAQYIITATGEILKRGIITCDDSGIITDIANTEGKLTELQNTEFYNGIIVPGFINCHCHLELSAMKGVLPEGTGLAGFIRGISENRHKDAEISLSAIKDADRLMHRSGISACADICNTALTFDIKERSSIEYINLLELFGVNPELAAARLESILQLKSEASKKKSASYIVPHSLYSISSTLMDSIKEHSRENLISSIHFMESADEQEYLESGSGSLKESYSEMGITGEMIDDRIRNHAEAIMNLITPSGNLILVHNTFAGEKEIDMVMRRGNTYWCLCPGSNRYIENSMPPVEILRRKGAEIVLGTDSLASNSSLSILDEMKILASHFPEVHLTELVKWACINGAKALSLDEKFGTIEKGKKPGLVLLENISLEKMELTDSVTARRIL